MLRDPAVTKRRGCLLLELSSRFSQLLSCQALQAPGTLFVFSPYLSDPCINGFLGVTLSLGCSLLQRFDLCFGLRFDLFRPLFGLVELFLKLGVKGVNPGLKFRLALSPRLSVLGFQLG